METISLDEIVYVYLTQKAKEIYSSLGLPTLTETESGASYWYLKELFEIFGPHLKSGSMFVDDKIFYTRETGEPQ